ncbi:hypothetical protein AHAS_Ahas11G0181500 [Arachis hypogaea]
MASKNPTTPKYNKTHDLRCSIRLLNEKFQNMSNEKKAIVQELGFDGLMHIPPMNVPHKLLKELAFFFDVITNRLDTWYFLVEIEELKQKIEGPKLAFNTSLLPYSRVQCPQKMRPASNAYKGPSSQCSMP